MKRVSFEVAKAIKDAGYPQENCNCYYNKNGSIDGYLGHNTAIPYCMQVWLWLWREKKIYIDIDCSDSYTSVASMLIKGRNFFDFFEKDDPEEAIEEAIEYLVTNKTILKKKSIN